jgi:hypothetical protein
MRVFALRIAAKTRDNIGFGVKDILTAIKQ